MKEIDSQDFFSILSLWEVYFLSFSPCEKSLNSILEPFLIPPSSAPMDSLHQLSLSEEEEELELQSGINSTQIVDPNLCLVDHFLTNRPIQSYMMMEKIETFWSPVRGVNIQEIEPNLYTFQFFHHLDLQRILKKGPWCFDNHLLILDVIPNNANPKSVTLQSVPFWIHVHDIPTGYMSEKVGKRHCKLHRWIYWVWCKQQL